VDGAGAANTVLPAGAGCAALAADWQAAIYELFMEKVKFSYLIDKHRHTL
jgi:hypothetical protein